MVQFPVAIDVFRRVDGRRERLERLTLPEAGRYPIGRLSENAIQLDAGQVSRVHAMLVVSKDGLEIVDCESTHGTFIGDAKVDRAPWDGRTPIRIEPYELHLVRDGAEPARPPRAERRPRTEPLPPAASPPPPAELPPPPPPAVEAAL